MLGNRATKVLVGLDITTSSIKLIELVQSGQAYRVESYAAEPTPPNAINEKRLSTPKSAAPSSPKRSASS